MGNPKLKWTTEEEEALIAGIAKHGTGKWKNIINDPQFGPLLTNRSNIDLKDKWRNMNVNPAAQGSKDKSGNARERPITIGALAPSTAQRSVLVTSVSKNEAIGDSPKSPPEVKNASKYNGMIFEALSSMKNSNESDLGAIVGFIERRHAVPQNFRRLLGSKLRRLVSQGKLERVQNCYKIKDATLETKIPTREQKDVQPWPTPSSAVKLSYETVEGAARNAAFLINEAENMSRSVAEAVKDAERVGKMAEDEESMLQLVNEIYEQCSGGQIVFLA